MSPLMYAKLGGAVAVIAGSAWLGYSYRDNACDAATQRARADEAEQAHANALAEIKRLQEALEGADVAVANRDQSLVKLQHEYETARKKLAEAADPSGCADRRVADDILRVLTQPAEANRADGED
jgi:hypothetical protein